MSGEAQDRGVAARQACRVQRDRRAALARRDDDRDLRRLKARADAALGARDARLLRGHRKPKLPGRRHPLDGAPRPLAADPQTGAHRRRGRRDRPRWRSRSADDCLTMFLELNEQEGPRSCCPRATELMSRRARCPGEALADVAQHEFAKFVHSAREGRLRTCSPRSVAACAWALRSAASYQRSSAKSPARRPPAGT